MIAMLIMRREMMKMKMKRHDMYDKRGMVYRGALPLLLCLFSHIKVWMMIFVEEQYPIGHR